MMRRCLAVILLAATAQAEAASMLLYGVQEAEGDRYPSRLLVTERFLRMDGGGGEDDGFVLFDRQQRVVYNVVHADRTIFSIPARSVPAESPLPLDLATETLPPAPATPTIAGQVPEHRRLSVNGAPCHEVVAVPGLLPDAVAAMRELRSILAGQRTLGLDSTPSGLLDACDLAINLFHPAWPLQFGLPIRESGVSGRTEVLLDFDADYPVESRLFLLPPDYEQFGM